MPHTILVPTDFSPGAGAALHVAEMLAKGTSTEIHLVHVKPSDILPHAECDVADSDDARLHELLSQTIPQEPGVTCHHSMLYGNPPDEILKFAKSHQVDMIVMGTHGQTNAPQDVVGQIASAVLEKADCPVLTVKRPAGVIVSGAQE